MDAATCPWSGFDPGTIAFCERRLCAWIVEPANTWSNIFYVLVGIWILWQERGRLSYLASIGVTAVLVGIGSTAFHGTGTFWGEYLDVSAMFLISGQFITFNVKRLFHWSDASLVRLYVAISLVSMALLATIRPIGIPLFALHVTIAGVLEVILFFKRPVPTRYWALNVMIVLFATAFFFWKLDISGVLCDPDNHIFGGHAAWHTINAHCLLFYYLYQKQFARQPAMAPLEAVG